MAVVGRWWGGGWYPPAERSSAAFNDEVNPRMVFDQWFQDSQACRVGLKELEQIGAKTMVSRQAGRERERERERER